MSEGELPIIDYRSPPDAAAASPTVELPAVRRGLSNRVRALATLFDQGVVSIATYLTGVLISHATKEGFGLYMLVFTLWIFGGEMHNSLVSTPQMLRLPRLSVARARRFNGSSLLHQLALSAAIVAGLLVAAGVLAVLGRRGDAALHDKFSGYALVALLAAVSIGPIVLRNFARNYCLATRDVPSALALDLGVSLVQLGGVAMVYAQGELKHWWIAVLVVAAANLCSTLLWLSMARRHFEFDVRAALLDARRNWSVARFIFLSSLLWTAGMFLYPWFISGLARDAAAGREAAGVWGACFALANLGNPLLMGIQNFMGPALAHAHADRDAAAFRAYVMRCTALFTLLVLPACAAMAFFAERLLTTFNGAQYAGNGRVTAILAFTMLLQGMSFPTSRGLFSIRRAGLDTAANVGPLVVLAALGPFLILRYGVTGAAVCLIVAQTIGSATRVVAFLRVTRPDRPEPARPQVTPAIEGA